ncbi:DUF7093 family protein [Halorussus amylolyticus]|uniref:DUF7093 family protein n=1 Tax=Halorussus amylolyticus TaxID=1126242 RepID=UPI00104D183A|nr:oxidoreductase [Halorussus amylolyticus]
MSLRCSLLGHTYGEAEIEREREEQGSEVVVTVREFKECGRCGDRSVVSENKEVTALETPGRSGSPSESDDAATDSPVAASGGDVSAESGGSGEGGAPGPGGTRSAAESDVSSPSVNNDFEQPQSAAEDDGVILDDADEEAADDDRQPGEWPDADTTHPAEADSEGGYTDWPEVDREDEGFDAEPADGASADVDFGGGLTPESAPAVEEDESEEVEFVNAEGDTLDAETGAERSGRADLSAGFTSSGSIPTPDGPAEDPGVDAEFVCPACGHRDTVAGSSLRAGDICPECRKGYIAQE